MQKLFLYEFQPRIEKYGEENVNVREVLLEMRKYRMGLIQTPNQLRFSYQAIIEGAYHIPEAQDIKQNGDKLSMQSKRATDKRQEIKDIISKEIEEYKSDLAQVKNFIEKRFHKSLSTIDNAYIERKYIEYCARSWQREIKNLLKALIRNKRRTIIQEIFNSLYGIRGLNQIPNLFIQLENYILLMKHYRFIRKEDENSFICKFKEECLNQIVAYSDSAINELAFLESFVNFLSSSKSLQCIAELDLEIFCCGDLSFDELINNIMKLKVNTYGETLTVLQKATVDIKKEKDLFLIDKFKEVLGAYIKPVEIQEKKIDGRLVIEITGKNLVVSEILYDLECKLSGNSDIEEVRFVGAIIHIDTDLKSEVWRGKNLVIFTKTIKVYGKVSWNVSGRNKNQTDSDKAGTGKDGHGERGQDGYSGKSGGNVSGRNKNQTDSNKAGTGKDGHGERGQDGYSGESGGNVLILTGKMENSENFTIISNGSDGSNGQDGGDGRDGDDGKGITKEEFDEKFPPVAKFFDGDRSEVILKTVLNIRKDFQVRETEWYEHTFVDTSDIDTMIFWFSREKLLVYSISKANIFINASTNQGHNITFSFERGRFKTNCQAFLIYKGSLGQPGGHGGEYGLGGQGGYAGEIIVINLENSSQEFGITKNTKQGKDGEKGKGGKYGSHGKNGWDIGYMDYSVSNFISEIWPQHFGRDENSTLSLEFFEDVSPERIRCPYREREGKRDIYAEMKTSIIEHRKQKKYEERKNTRQNNDRQHHAQAVRKNNISQRSILGSYSHHLNSIEKNTMQNLRSDLENIKQQALQAITENQEQQEKKTTELEIKLYSPYQNKSKHYNDIFITTSCTTCKDTNDVESYIDMLNNEPLLLDNWFLLQLIELSFSQLDQVFLIFEDLQSLLDITENSKLQAIEKLLIEKYRLATLQKIAKQLLSHQEVVDKDITPKITSELTPESAAKFLVEAKENDSNIPHDILGTLNQYFYENSKEQRENISKFSKEKLQNKEYEALKHSIRAFVLEVGELEKAHADIRKYYNEHKEFLKNQEHSSNIFFDEFESELSQPRHAEIFDLWIESIKDTSLISKFEEKIKNDDDLKFLYNRFNNQLLLEYDWDKCCKDQAILNEYNNHIQEKGPLSDSYREFLAYIFDINIRLYAEHQDNKLFLGDHNRLSKHTIHILYRDNKFIQLNIDKNHLKLVEERKKIDSRYAKIFAEIKPFKQKQEFDDYVKNEAFLSNNSPSENEQSFNEDYIEKIIEYFPEGERQQLKGQLDKITSQYIEQHEVLKNSSSEGRRVSSQELSCFVNSILASSIEKAFIEKITKYFPEEERQQLKERLDKIKAQCIGQHGVFHHILKSFSSEGRHVSSQELYCFINSILASSIEDREEQNIFCWIAAAHSQRKWIDELILLRIENYLKEPLAQKSTWREYLSRIENKDILLLLEVKLDQHRLNSPISTQCIKETLHLLSNIPNEKVSLAGLELSEWPYALKEKYWTCNLSKLVNWQKGDDLPTASYYLLSMENTFGTDLVEKFLKALEEKKQKLSPNLITEILSNFHNEKWNLSKRELNTLNNYNIGEWIQKMQQKFTADKEERKIMQLVELIKGNANTSKKIEQNLLKIAESILNICDEKYADNFMEKDIEKWAKKFKTNISKGKQSIKEKYNEMLAVIDRAIELKRGLELKREFKLRDTQKLTVLALLTNDSSALAQVSTGEGKSLIVVAVSIMKALCGEKVDIITSSSVLAKRDAEDNRDIYNLFDINVSHNCSEDIDKRKEAYSGSQVVYGDLSNFQRDYLLDKFYGKNILGSRNFESVIVDEVDSMLLDKGNNMLYLSHDLAGLEKLESVYIYIWQWITKPANSNEEISYGFDARAIKEAVMGDLYELVKIEDIKKLGPELSEQHKNIIWERLIKAEILDNQGKLLNENIDDDKLNEIFLPEFCNYKDRFIYLLNECIEREKHIKVPNNLRPFIEYHLESWINSAIFAFFMKAGEDYVLDVDRTGMSPDRNPNIRILDRDTGTDQMNSQWNEALHQFLQLKHGCKLSLQSLKAVFISNVSFFKLYSNLYGLTGTLGSQRERDLLQELYEVDFVTIPTAKSKLFHEDRPILCTDKDGWIESIHNRAKELTVEKNRSVLIICETVNVVETVYKAFAGKEAKHVHTYIRDYEEFDIAQGNKELEQGQIVIATNLAGRGTDIKITERLRKAGGLHVCLTYLPSNIRIEQQAFGRAARCGDKGSGQLIVMDSEGQAYSNSKVLDLKKERDAEEINRISDIKTHYDTQITMEESCFKAFKEQYEQLKKDLNGKKVPTEVKEILLQSCLDRWVFWLDKNNNSIKNVTDEQSKRSFNSLLSKFISWLKDLDTGYSEKYLQPYCPIGPPCPVIEYDSKSWLAWVEGNPVQMVKLGRYLCQNKKHKNAHENAIKLFDEVIEKEPNFSEAAHYYKAFALAKNIDWERKPLDKKHLKEFKKELWETARLLEEHSKFSMNAASIIGKIKKNNNESIIQIDAYEEQQKSFANLYYMFSQSILDILGHPVTPQSFVDTDIKENSARDLYEALLKKHVLKKSRVKKNISEKELKVISSDYGILIQELKDFLSENEGKEIIEKEFQKALKKAIPLPSREAFWKLLIQEKVLSEEVKYVVVDNEKLGEIDSPSLDFLTNKVNEGKLKKQALEATNEQILLNLESVTQQTNNDYVFTKGDFIEIVGKKKYKTLKEKGVLSFNKKARVNLSKIESTVLSDYDSITIKDFTDKANITQNEAEKILAELVEQSVLEKDPENSIYRLKIKFDEIAQVQLPFYPVYENAVKGLFFACFTYRIVLQKIVSQMEEKNSAVHLQLMTKPHQRLILELFEQQIIKPVTVARNDKDLIEDTVKDTLNELQLTDTDIIKNVIKTLERSRSSLKALEVSDYKLKPFTELCNQGDFGNIEEVHVFSLNGLDQVLQLNEKKWTRKMLINTAIVTVFGISQIALGTVIELYSAGIWTHVGAAFINEGVNDLFFAAGALTSGYFSWKDYGWQKLESVMISVFSAGIGMYFSRGAKVSRFGRKLAAPALEVGGKKVSEMCGTRLIKEVGWKKIGKEFTKRIMLKTMEGLAFGLASAGVDKLIENYLQGLCESIASCILSNIEQTVEKHDISANLKEVYETLGEEKARKMVNDLTQNTFTEPNCAEKFFSIVCKIASCVNQGIAKAVEKTSTTSNKLVFPIHTISKVLVWNERVTHIANITTITGKLLNDLDGKIKNKLSSNKLKKNVELNQNQEGEKDYERFKKELVDQWKLLLCEKAGQVISQHILSPILKEGANYIIRCVGRKAQKVYQSYKESEYFERFEELKQGYEEKLKNRQQHSNESTTDHITEKYHKDLLKLMKKTRNIKLFANIVRENIPMDITCVNACTQVIHKIMKKLGIETPITIVVEGDGGKRQKISTASDGTDGVIIKLELKNNHFEFCGSSTLENKSSESKNNCLYDALTKAIPGLKDIIGPTGFRSKIADCIENDEGIQHHIKQGWHELPLDLGMFGGKEAKRRLKSDLCHHEDSSSFNEEKHGNKKQYETRVRKISKHILDRLNRTIEFGGILNRISKETNIPIEEIIQPGRSQFQDQSSGKGKDIHAGHVTRAGEINPKLKEYPELYNELKNVVGHTQNINKVGNMWHGIGGDIDRVQETNLKELIEINFASFGKRGRPKLNDTNALKRLKKGYKAIVNKHLNKVNLDDTLRSQLVAAKKILNKITIKSLREKGKKGFSGKGKEAFQKKS